MDFRFKEGDNFVLLIVHVIQKQKRKCSQAKIVDNKAKPFIYDRLKATNKGNQINSEMRKTRVKVFRILNSLTRISNTSSITSQISPYLNIHRRNI